MPRADRMFELVQLLAGRSSRTVQEIADRFDITERTVYRDLNSLEERHIPLVRDEYGYRLVDSATLRPINLTPREYAMLRLALANPALRYTFVSLRHLGRDECAPVSQSSVRRRQCDLHAAAPRHAMATLS